MNQINDSTLDVTAKDAIVNIFEEYSFKNKCDITVVQYDKPFNYIKKFNVSNGNIDRKNFKSFDKDLILSDYEIYKELEKLLNNN